MLSVCLSAETDGLGSQPAPTWPPQAAEEEAGAIWGLGEQEQIATGKVRTAISA